MKKQSFNIAFGGMISAICVALEFSVGIFPLFLYIFPMICAFLMNILLEECGLKVCASAYIGVSLISWIISPDKEAALMYTAFFGYYPIARLYIEKLKGKPLKWSLKLLLFNTSIVCAYLLLIKFVGLEATGLDGAKWMWIILLSMGNVAFVMFDILMARILYLYEKKYRGRLFGKKKH